MKFKFFIFFIIIIKNQHTGCKMYCSNCEDRNINLCNKCINRALLIVENKDSDNNTTESSCKIIENNSDCLYTISSNNFKKCILCNNNMIPIDIPKNGLKQYDYSTKCVAGTINNCGIIDLKNNCLACLNNTYPSKDKKSCIKIINNIENCISYKNNGLCYFCNSPYFVSLDNKQCLLKEEGLCVRSNQKTDDKICRECEDNYYLDFEKNKCFYSSIYILEMIFLYFIYF